MSKEHEDYNRKGALGDSYFTNEEAGLGRGGISSDHNELEAGGNQ